MDLLWKERERWRRHDFFACLLAYLLGGYFHRAWSEAYPWCYIRQLRALLVNVKSPKLVLYVLL